MKNLIAKIPEDLHKKLKLYSVESGREMREIIRQLLEEFFAKEEKKPKKR